MKKKVSFLIIFKYTCIFFIFIIFISSSKKKSLLLKIEEKEKNDTFISSNLVFIDSSIHGTLSQFNDRDIYKLDLTKKSKKQTYRKVSILLSPIKEFDARIILYKNKRIIKIIDDFKKNSAEILPSLILDNSIYHIEVSIGYYGYLEGEAILKNQDLLHQKKNYILKILDKTNHLVINKNKILEKEPNDSPSQSQNLTINKPIQGFFRPFFNWTSNNKKIDTLNPFPFLKHNLNLSTWIKKNPSLKKVLNYDMDWYTIKNSKNEIKSIFIKNKTKHIYLITGLFNKNKKLLFLSNPEKIGKNEKIENFLFLKNQTYYLLIIGIPTNQHIMPSFDLFEYEVVLEKSYVHTNSSISIEIEPNDSLNQLSPIYSNIIQGYLANQNDRDCFKISLYSALEKSNITNKNTSVYFYFELFPIYNIDTQIEIYSHTKKLLKIYNTLSFSKSEKIYQTRFQKMPFIYTCIKQYSFNTIKRTQGHYQFEYKILTKKDQNLEVEWNDTLSLSQFLPLDTEIKGYINPIQYFDLSMKQKNDIDIYKVSLEKNKIYEILIKGIPSLPLEVKIYSLSDKNQTFPYKEMIVYDEKLSKLLFDTSIVSNFKIPLNKKKQTKSLSNIQNQLFFITIKSLLQSKGDHSSYYSLKIKPHKN